MIAEQFAGELLQLIFENTNIANVGDATGLRGSTVAGSLYISLHTADPEGGSQTTSETAYTGYARVAVARSTSGWTVAGIAVDNDGAITFPQCTGGSSTVTHWGIGTSSSGAGKLLWSGPIGTVPKLCIGIASDNTLRLQTGHGLAVDNQVILAYPSIADPIGGVSMGVVYYIKTLSGDVATLSATQAGAELDITDDGAGLISKASPLAISNGITPSFAAQALNVRLD